MRLPKGFEEQLAQLTEGNPLFVSEIMRKLILGGKITLSGQVWNLEPLEGDYLPRSLEEIVSHKIAVLNKESRKLLDQASTFGEHVSLSMLAGSSETKETQVTEFIDQAVAQGLIGTQYQMNDETIRFLSRRILDITYGAIQDKRKRNCTSVSGNTKKPVMPNVSSFRLPPLPTISSSRLTRKKPAFTVTHNRPTIRKYSMRKKP